MKIEDILNMYSIFVHFWYFLDTFTNNEMMSN